MDRLLFYCNLFAKFHLKRHCRRKKGKKRRAVEMIDQERAFAALAVFLVVLVLMFPNALTMVSTWITMVVCYGLGTLIGWVTARIDRKPLGARLVLKGILLDKLLVGLLVFHGFSSSSLRIA